MAAALTHIIDQAAFEPNEITAMSIAFELACADLQVSAADQNGRETIALRIIDLARGGVIDAATLHQRVVRDARTGA